MNDKDFDLVRWRIEDCCRLIAAGKVQRWEIVKWAITANLGVATASIAIGREQLYFFIFSIIITILSEYLLYYYNRRMTRARSRLTQISIYISQALDTPKEILTPGMLTEKGLEYDREELYVFGGIVALSLLPSLITITQAISPDIH